MLLEVKALTVRYGKATAVTEASLNVEKGEIVTLIGANGAGKTTVLRAISGLVRVAGGEVRFEGNRIDRLKASGIVRLGISHVPEGRRVFPFMTVLQNLTLGAYTRRDNRQRDDLERVYQLFPILYQRRYQKAGSLSGGEQQMLAIGRALMSSPRLLLLDEPSIGLAPIVMAQLSKVIKDINASLVSVILVEQNARMALALAHRGYVLETGRIVLEGKSEDLVQNPQVRKAYLGTY